MTGIYKIENLLNHKCYIGQALDIELRWDQHKESLQESMSSWYPEARNESNNINDFEFTLLQECKPEELDELEAYWIKKFDSYKQGYNRTSTGQYFQGKSMIDLTQMRTFSSNEIYKFMREMKDNTFKLWIYLHEKSKTNKFILKSPSLISKDTGISSKGAFADTITELISLGYMTVDENKNLTICI